MSEQTDVFIYHSHDPHTAIPDWVPFCHQLGPEARNLITATLVLQKRGHPPTRLELAQALRVDRRSIYRWLEEIASAGAMSNRRVGRRRLTVFHKPKGDRAITDRPITDRPITDRPITLRDSDSSEHVRLGSHETPIGDQAITDRAGGGGGSVLEDSDPPPATAPRRKISPHEITGETGRWMVAEGFSLTKAHQHQSLPLAPAQADYQRRKQLGQGHGAIALAWEVAPPAGDGQAVPLEPSSGEFTFSEHEKERYRAMGFAIGDDPLESEESNNAA
jgi:hypothetical protein